ncbi:MAG: transcription elongation factor GreB [Bdellovibrionaceae bacterium]|nr:transcription elongation factor GreB [Pseudobdellovibrionaceae bacterium]
MTAKFPNYITTEGFEKLQDEFKQLFQNERPKLIETIAWAASNGDRSENGDYIYGKRRLREIDRRLLFLRDRIESAQVINPKAVQSEKVVFGATVVLVSENDQEKVYQIVGEDEIEPGKNKISWKAPLAKAILGKKEGDEVVVRLPSGKSYFEIKRIEFK